MYNKSWWLTCNNIIILYTHLVTLFKCTYSLYKSYKKYLFNYFNNRYIIFTSDNMGFYETINMIYNNILYVKTQCL